MYTMDDCGDIKISIAKSNRKIAKPIMEKKRRARINASLNELKSLLVEVLQKEGCRHSSKMEKADILEMAVRHLKNLQRQQSYSVPTTHSVTRDSFQTPLMEKFSPSMVDNSQSTYLPTTPDSTVLTSPKLDTNKNILPAPQPITATQPIILSPTLNQSIPVMTRTANGELAVVLPQSFMKQNNMSTGFVLPIYTMPQDTTCWSPMTNTKTVSPASSPGGSEAVSPWRPW